MTTSTLAAGLELELRLRDTGALFDPATMLTAHATPLLPELVAIAGRAEYLDEDGKLAHVLTFTAVEHGTLSARHGYPITAGVEIRHGDCCPGRQDANVFAERIHIGNPRSGAQFPAKEVTV